MRGSASASAATTSDVRSVEPSDATTTSIADGADWAKTFASLDSIWSAPLCTAMPTVTSSGGSPSSFRRLGNSRPYAKASNG